MRRYLAVSVMALTMVLGACSNSDSSVSSLTAEATGGSGGGATLTVAGPEAGAPTSTGGPDGGHAIVPGVEGLDADGAMRFSEADHCPVCGKGVLSDRRFTAAIALDDGTTYYFCCPSCMHRAWRDPEGLLRVSAQRLRKAVVADIATGEQLDVRAALFVDGSGLHGPCGPTLVPVRTEEMRTKFIAQYGGVAASPDFMVPLAPPEAETTAPPAAAPPPDMKPRDHRRDGPPPPAGTATPPRAGHGDGPPLPPDGGSPSGLPPAGAGGPPRGPGPGHGHGQGGSPPAP